MEQDKKKTPEKIYWRRHDDKTPEEAKDQVRWRLPLKLPLKEIPERRRMALEYFIPNIWNPGCMVVTISTLASKKVLGWSPGQKASFKKFACSLYSSGFSFCSRFSSKNINLKLIAKIDFMYECLYARVLVMSWRPVEAVPCLSFSLVTYKGLGDYRRGIDGWMSLSLFRVKKILKSSDLTWERNMKDLNAIQYCFVVQNECLVISICLDHLIHIVILRYLVFIK